MKTELSIKCPQNGVTPTENCLKHCLRYLEITCTWTWEGDLDAPVLWVGEITWPSADVGRRGYWVMPQKYATVQSANHLCASQVPLSIVPRCSRSAARENKTLGVLRCWHFVILMLSLSTEWLTRVRDLQVEPPPKKKKKKQTNKHKTISVSSWVENHIESGSWARKRDCAC